MQRLQIHFIIKVCLFIVIFGGILIYTIFNIRAFILGPKITILEPLNGISTTSPTIVIKGTIVSSTKLTLNDFPISITEQGSFSEIVLLHNGYNIIEIENTDRFKRNERVLLEFIRIQTSSTLATSSPASL